ncbi:class I SAM-dependent methyltransferase [Streptomyces sp. NPDC059611]|uniref:class I SAM-dependent methyltransferase n=1 Tax=Streptomyces sp. NPDC059611 TaxID=3346884 RepID=UPI00369567B7
MTTIDWDAAAGSFDEEPDHGLHDPAVRDAWAGRLESWLPATRSDVLDLGCGTGSLSLLAAGQGHRVTAVDRSPGMAELARAKLAGTGAEVLVGDACLPPVGERAFDVILARHVVWLLPDPAAALHHWFGLLKPGGRLVLVEGVWGGVGLPAARITALLAPHTERVHHEDLAGDARLWGKEVDDERYALVARAEPPTATPRSSTSISSCAGARTSCSPAEPARVTRTGCCTCLPVMRRTGRTSARR